MGNDKTQHEKLDGITEVVTEVRIELGKIGVHLDNAEKERGEMKEDIETLESRKKLQTVWDGINTAIGLVIAGWLTFKKNLP